MPQTAVSVIETIGAGLCLGIHELYGVVQLHIAKVSNGRMDVPPEVIPTVLGRIIGQEIVIGFVAVLALVVIWDIVRERSLAHVMSLGIICFPLILRALLIK